jgi:uroporphyrinogen decarboxylase
MNNDRMSNRERIDNLLNRKSIDRVPLYPFVLGFCARNMGQPISTIYSDAEKSFSAQMATFEQFGFDWGPNYGYASYGTWEFGGIIELPSGGYQQAPAHKMFPVKAEEDIDKLTLPDVTTAGCLPLAMEFSRLQQHHNVPISVIMGGNFTIAGNICPVETLLRWMIRKPEITHRIMRLATDHIISVVEHWADTFGADNIVPQLWEPTASNDIISPRLFEKYVLPYLCETSERFLDMGIRNFFFHICGEQNSNLPMWADVPMGNPGLCSFGAQIDLKDAISFLGRKSIIVGNIEPSEILEKSADTVYGLCVDAIEAGKNAPRGFMLSSGCEIAPATPHINIHAMRKAIDDSGWY